MHGKGRSGASGPGWDCNCDGLKTAVRKPEMSAGIAHILLYYISINCRGQSFKPDKGRFTLRLSRVGRHSKQGWGNWCSCEHPDNSLAISRLMGVI